jgi:hypothetical protein
VIAEWSVLYPGIIFVPSELIQSSLNNKKIEFERKKEEKVEGILLRSKANWHENGEKCSQYFCKLEKKNFIKKTITYSDTVSLIHVLTFST